MGNKLFITFLLLGVIWNAASQTCPNLVPSTLCYVMHPGDEWNRPITTDPVDYMSDCIIQTMDGSSGSGPLRFDFISEESSPYTIQNTGFHYALINGNQQKLPLQFGVGGANYYDESDYFGTYPNSATFPLPQNAPIEGWNGPGQDPSGGDRHIIAIDYDHCMLYETYYSVRLASGFRVASSAIWNMTLANNRRPDGWTSADAAGLPIYPGLLKYEEAASGSINHPIRFTYPDAQAAYTYPGNHFGPYGNTDTTLPVYGSRFRLNALYPSNADPLVNAIIQALKTYGMIYADQGSAIFLSGVSDSRWGNSISVFNGLQIPITEFEIVQSPSSIVRHYTPTSQALTCNAATNNANPNWSPSWTPNPACTLQSGTSGVDTGSESSVGSSSVITVCLYLVLFVAFML